MPLADILRSRDSKALSDEGLSGNVPEDWQQAKHDLVQALEHIDEFDASESQEKTQIASGFENLRTEVRTRPQKREPEADKPAATKAPSQTPAVRTQGLTTEPAASVSVKPASSAPVAKAPSAPSAPPVIPPPMPAAAPPVVAPIAASEGMGKRGVKAKVKNQVLVFFSCKGGSGATALAVNVAHAYARDKLSCCLVDMDLQLGDTLAALGLKSKMTLAQAAAGALSGDRLVRERLPVHASGVGVLSQVGSLDDLDTVSSENMAKLVEGLRDSFDVIALDGVRDFSDNVLAVLDVADKIAIITVQEILSIRRARWSFNILRKIGFDPKEITVVVNKFDPASDVPLASMKTMFEPATVVTVPNDPSAVLQSLNRGVPLQEVGPNRPVTRHMGRLANNLIGVAVPEESETIDDNEVSVFKRMLRKFK
ncbi:hypothetical protein Q3G72_026070 [Acer saccharum]|nr:hypothetical protein Q3G72_026070 [Acer saccharum]